jgi:hypothetical protein
VNKVSQPEEVVIVTEDKWMREAGGRIDFTDQQLLDEASEKGRLQVQVLNFWQILEIMSQSEPEKYQKFRKEMERRAGHRLTFEEMVEIGRKADERLQEFTRLIGGSMTRNQATQVRIWRVNYHMTWRSVARAAYNESWFSRSWQPPSNQLMGMALCEEAAALFKENFREEPWN